MSRIALPQYLANASVAPDLQSVILGLAEVSADISKSLAKGALAGILGAAGAENVQGEDQKKLDVIANDMIKEALAALPNVRGLASEEEPDVVPCHTNGNFLVTFDPLDGSSNIDINSMVGTIFSVLPHTGETAVTEQDFLQPGRQQAAAGYVLYGPSVMLVISTGSGVAMFTLDQDSGNYLLTEADVAIPSETNEFSINASNQRHWAAPMQSYIADLIAGKDGPRGKNFNMRWVAAMVADVHRILCRGGLFTYPWDSRKPEQAGKLRLMYEANPMGFLVEQAGGEVWTPEGKILDIQPAHIHQRVPVILGAATEVALCVDYHQR
ncbi:Fructose-1,6-bisphosphatase class 1 [Zhongshania aliphaticivorans]|uniref:Fructose-1,6-bisphosphatase class 1 n=1 Tax=Zhongshania aliphaticivorans TaxID=1470434 RepID=A0A5S9PN08_9GAMM|nr:class 1 fructose-bisphosphatase [Zhongshania aliphaticivorans]CAA0105805.1 Fructose-1,6-bisphosphatase class 1 [Zhongshania aliphaticivorans]CAA0105997.1 Fructose-1,6-bisphosphatase class 1 [Zhongshania aliphaticivorans]